MNKLNEEILAKFLMGECTEDELREVNAWLEESGCRKNGVGFCNYSIYTVIEEFSK